MIARPLTSAIPRTKMNATLSRDHSYSREDQAVRTRHQTLAEGKRRH